MSQVKVADAGYKGLMRVEPTLPTSWYLDREHYQRELESIWYRQWVYVCRSAELAEARQYKRVELGDQQLIVLRDEQGELQAYHNTCRHRGSLLLTEPEGRLRGQSLTCPYHAWSYSLQGELKRTPSKFCQQGFEPAELSLYDIAVREWRGFIFINLNAEDAPSLESCMDFNGRQLANWPLEDLVVGHSIRKTVACNWKVFWENFNECLHCPGVHPELSALIPLYKRAIMEVQDDPQWQTLSENGDPRFKDGLAEGAETWSADGVACDRAFPGLTEQELANGHTFEVLLPTIFIVGHVDYVRVVRLIPLGPEQTEIQAEWLYRPETLARDDFDVVEFSGYAELVMGQDARVAELNQQGLHCIRHQHGALMAEEYDVFNLQNWVREQLSA
jgi:phenylpropionate dioxygenase-like ring-hydroxylating dioxygenase large terminal subunit